MRLRDLLGCVSVVSALLFPAVTQADGRFSNTIVAREYPAQIGYYINKNPNPNSGVIRHPRVVLTYLSVCSNQDWSPSQQPEATYHLYTNGPKILQYLQNSPAMVGLRFIRGKDLQDGTVGPIGTGHRGNAGKFNLFARKLTYMDPSPLAPGSCTTTNIMNHGTAIKGYSGHVGWQGYYAWATAQLSPSEQSNKDAIIMLMLPPQSRSTNFTIGKDGYMVAGHNVYLTDSDKGFSGAVIAYSGTATSMLMQHELVESQVNPNLSPDSLGEVADPCDSFNSSTAKPTFNLDGKSWFTQMIWEPTDRACVTGLLTSAK